MANLLACTDIYPLLTRGKPMLQTHSDETDHENGRPDVGSIGSIVSVSRAKAAVVPRLSSRELTRQVDKLDLAGAVARSGCGDRAPCVRSDNT